MFNVDKILKPALFPKHANPGAAFEPIGTAGRMPAFAAVPSYCDSGLSFVSREGMVPSGGRGPSWWTER